MNRSIFNILFTKISCKFLMLFLLMLLVNCTKSQNSLESIIDSFQLSDQHQYNIFLNTKDSSKMVFENIIYEKIDSIILITGQKEIVIKSKTWSLIVYSKNSTAVLTKDDAKGYFYSPYDPLSLLKYSAYYFENIIRDDFTNIYILLENPFGIEKVILEHNEGELDIAEFCFIKNKDSFSRKFVFNNNKIFVSNRDYLKNIKFKDSSIQLKGDLKEYYLIDIPN